MKNFRNEILARLDDDSTGAIAVVFDKDGVGFILAEGYIHPEAVTQAVEEMFEDLSTEGKEIKSDGIKIH